jgi:hypothetical protein
MGWLMLTGVMPPPLRSQFPGPIYHLMNRGDRRESIFRNDLDRQCFLITLGQPIAPNFQAANARDTDSFLALLADRCHWPSHRYLRRKSGAALTLHPQRRQNRRFLY